MRGFAVCLLLLCVRGGWTMTINSDAPGNLFVAGRPMECMIADAAGTVDYEVKDYFGKKAADGKLQPDHGNAHIVLPGLPPGWYELQCNDSVGAAITSLGVVIHRGNAPLPIEGRVCGDAASAWLLHSEAQRKPFARMIRLAGIPWVRERLSWGEVERTEGKIDWGRYQAVADALAAEGIHIYQIFHDSPGWTHSNNPNTLCPDDLRDVYRFTRAAASRFHLQIQAWEIWNEPDIGFWPDLGDRYAGLEKAACLGLKDGNPKSMVLAGSLCRGVSPFDSNIYESGIGDYFDVFNWHIYADPTAAYPPTLANYLKVLRPYGSADRPVWLTEAGIAVPGTEGEGQPKRLLNAEGQRRQCRFVPQSVAMSLAAGTDKHFFFVVPDYLENGIQFGSLHPDLSPYPSFVALSATANILGLSEYIGELRVDNNSYQARVFSTPRGNVIVAWANAATTMTIPTDKTAVHVANIFGAETKVKVENGKAIVTVGPEAVYVIGVGDQIRSKLRGTPRARGKLPSLKPSRVVIVGHSNLPRDKDRDCYIVSGSTPFDFEVDVYNFNRKPVSGSVEIVPPKGWRVEVEPSRPKGGRSVRGDDPEVQLASLGRLEPRGVRKTRKCRLAPGGNSLEIARVLVEARLVNNRVAPSVSCFARDPASVEPTRRKPLPLANPSAWKPEASANGTVAVTSPAGNAIRVQARFHGEVEPSRPKGGRSVRGDRWAYPHLALNPPEDFSDYDGIAFDLSSNIDATDSFIRLMLVEPGGAHYLTGTPTFTTKRRVVFLFRDFNWGPFSPADADGRLDLNQIVAIKLGCNTPKDDLTFDAGNFELVKFE